MDKSSTQHPDREHGTCGLPQTAASSPILTHAEAARRMLLLAELQAALAMDGIRSVLARHHRLVLKSNASPFVPSGLTEPELHIFTPDSTEIATTDGTSYSLTSGPTCPAADPSAAATTTRLAHREANLTGRAVAT